MRHSTFRAVPGKGGFIRTTLAPINDRRDLRFTMMDFTMLMALVLGALFMARVMIAH